MYLMAYFRTRAEALHLALSADGLRWKALNDNRPVLEGAFGPKPSLRDPFILRAPDGRFHLLATNGWESDSIIHAASDDLIEWTPQELWPVMRGVGGVRNCWAPEAFFDHEAGLYRVIWSSSTTREAGKFDWDHRIWQVTTTDFQSYSAPSIFFDPGYSVIDACVGYHAGTYLMAFKDERGDNLQPPAEGQPWKAIRVCSGRRATGPWTELSDFVTPSLSEGPTLYRLGDRWVMVFDRFMHRRFGAVESADGRCWTDIADRMRFPRGPRHACVLRIDEETALRLRERWG